LVRLPYKEHIFDSVSWKLQTNLVPCIPPQRKKRRRRKKKKKKAMMNTSLRKR
jgi:hypothetical protein